MIIWIGDKVEVVSGPYSGIEGEIVYETKNTFLIEKENGRKVKVPKKGIVFVVKGKGRYIGDDLISRPWTRVVKDQ